jgi:hypothetical protein
MGMLLQVVNQDVSYAHMRTGGSIIYHKFSERSGNGAYERSVNPLSAISS